MQLGYKNRLRLISFIPLLVLFTLASYFAYTSFNNYLDVNKLQNKLSENRYLNELLSDISKERGLSIMHLGDTSTHTSTNLSKQRNIVDSNIRGYINFIQNSEASYNDNTARILESLQEKIKIAREKTDQKESNLKDTYKESYGAIQATLMKQLERVANYHIDPQIIELSSTYISLVRAKKATSTERDLITYALTRSSEINITELNMWLSLIAKSGLGHYDTLHNKELAAKLDAHFKQKKNLNLVDGINLERTDIISSASTGYFGASPDNWFSLLSEKENIVLQAQDLLLEAMEDRANIIQKDALQMFIISLVIWVIAILTALLSLLLLTEISNNIKGLETVLNRVAHDTKDLHKDDIDIDLQSTEGTNEAYKLLEKIIKQTREDKIAAQEASEAKSMFLANMSHEIRTPLNGIVGFTELLKDSGLEDEQIEFVDIIEKSSENLLEIINNILDLSKIESNKLEIEDTIFNPIEEFESAVEVYAVRASEKHIDLGCFIDPQLEQLLKGDPTKLKEVIINLLSNAVKFTSSSGAINIDIRKIESERTGFTKIKFEVQDTGIGVTGEQKERIFEAFSQADTSITRKYGGTGLGLTISSKFIELMGGQLDLESEPGKGTTFFFTLEFEEVERLNELTKGNYMNITALILEGNHKHKIQDNYIREYLDYYGVDYTIFKDKEEVDLLISQNDYNLLFVDYDYAGEHGLAEYAKLPQDLVLITKATYMRRLDSLEIEIFKALYEPLNNTKIKTLLESYYSKNLQVKKDAKKKRKVFNASTSKFKANVLVAEDNIINQKLIKRTLEDLGLTITIANNGLEAFQKRKDGKYDLMFMDIQMPFLDGMEATKEILEYEEDYNQKHIPIVAITANALKGDRERFLEAGLDEYTTKPLIRDEIITILTNYLSDFIIDDESAKAEAAAIEEPTLEIDDNVVKELEKMDSPIIEAEVLDNSIQEQNVAKIESVTESDIIIDSQTQEQNTEIIEDIAFEQEHSIVTTEDTQVEDKSQSEKLEEPIVDKESEEIIVLEDATNNVNKDENTSDVEEIVNSSQERKDISVVDEIENVSQKEELERSQEEPTTYKADILLGKKNAFEAKLFARLLASLGYSYEIANSSEEIDESLSTSSYKVILFDKELEKDNLNQFSQKVKDLNNKTDLNTSLILIDEPLNETENDDHLYVQEIIASVVNKDSLKHVLDKFIQG